MRRGALMDLAMALVMTSDAVNVHLELHAIRTGRSMPSTGSNVISGISALPVSHPLHLGMPGMHGEVHVNRAIQRADVIVAIGLRFDDRVTGNTKGFAPRAKIVHVDLDASEIGKNVPVALALVGDARSVTERLVAHNASSTMRPCCASVSATPSIIWVSSV